MPKMVKVKCHECNEESELLVHPSTMPLYCPLCDSEDVEQMLGSFRIARSEPWLSAGQRLK